MYRLNSHLSLQLILRAFRTGIKGRIRRILLWHLIFIKLIVKKCLGCCVRINRLIHNPRHPRIILIIFSFLIVVVLVLLIWSLELHLFCVILVVIFHLICNLLTWIKIRILELVTILYSDMVLTILLQIRLESDSWIE